MVAPSALQPSPVRTSMSLAVGGVLSSSATTVGSDTTSGAGNSGAAPSGALRVYSPSETANYLQCPILRQFRRPSVIAVLGETEPHTWEPRSSGEWDPGKLLGIAVQAGLSRHLESVRGGGTGIATDEVEEQVCKALEAGFVEQPRYTLEGLTKIALRGVQALLDANLFERHTILEVDQPLTHSRPDVISRHETQGLGVTDFKVSQRIDERYRAKRMAEYETDDQFWHYVWEVGEHYGEPVKWVRVIQAILTPRAVTLVGLVPVTPSRLQFWLSGAEQHWRDMAAEDRGERPIVPRWPNCKGGRYGTCIAYDYCHNLDRDPVRALVYYERVPR